MEDLLEWIAHSLASCLFLLVPSSRKRTLARWSQQSQMATMGEVLGILLGAVVLVILLLMLWKGISAGAS